MSRNFVRISKQELINKIMTAVKKYDLYDDMFDEDTKNNPEYQQGTDGDKEIGPLGSIAYWNWRDITPQVTKDFSKCQFDLENIILGKRYVYDMGSGYSDELDLTDEMNSVKGLITLDNGLTFLGVMAGGDWEYPVFFMIYWDGKKLRGYVPIEGNMWNTSAKMAYGNNSEGICEAEGAQLDEDNCMKRFGTNTDFTKPDAQKIIQDITERIKEKVCTSQH